MCVCVWDRRAESIDFYIYIYFSLIFVIILLRLCGGDRKADYAIS